MNFLKKLFNRKHVHYFSKPVASMYIGFNTRDIAYKCRCGEGKIYRIHRNFGDPFPIETNIMMSREELERIANA